MGLYGIKTKLVCLPKLFHKYNCNEIMHTRSINKSNCLKNERQVELKIAKKNIKVNALQ